ncbi:MAG TPA: type II secretion system protein [Candidatus Pristimantibacillus sp.]|nr:type II secretion system protein [Candidatus Pristimantibacillus sp.]
MKRRTNSQRGATLVEVLVAIALTGVMLPTLATALVTSHAGKASAQQQLQASALLHEATEAVRVVREAGWGNIAANGTYHPAVSGSTWTLASSPETIGNFTRTVTISDAERNSSGALVASSGTIDPATKHIEVSVDWTTPYSGSVSDDLYLSRWQNETAWSQTTDTEFNTGTTTNTAVTATNGGQVELAAGSPTYQTSGTFESETFDAGANAAYHYLSMTASQPGGTTINFQIATNNDNSTWNYVGPDGTNGTFFTGDNAIPLNATDARYFRYKAFLTGDGSVTPVLSDIQVTYAP